MNNKFRTIALIVIGLILAGLCAGCGPAAAPEQDIMPYAGPDSPGEDSLDLAPEMIPLTESPAMFMIPAATASGTAVMKNEKTEIDYSNTKDGYIMVKYLQKTSQTLYVQITGPSGVTYQYRLSAEGGYEVYPLSDGNGSYKVSVLEKLPSNKAALAGSVTLTAQLSDEFAPFIRPNQYVNYHQDSETVKKAAELLQGHTDIVGQIAAVYEYVIGNIAYDKDKAAQIKSGAISVYLPDVDAVLNSRKGICFDYAAVMTAMLRSQGIPCKLVVGYSGEIYHAWINAYSAETGWINNVIYFDGKSWKLMDPTFASTGKQSDEIVKYIGDGSNYQAKFLY